MINIASRVLLVRITLQPRRQRAYRAQKVDLRNAQASSAPRALVSAPAVASAIALVLPPLRNAQSAR